MLTGVRMTFIGGDARQLEVIKACVEMDATVSLIGFDNLNSDFPGTSHMSLNEKALEQTDVLVLPIVGCDDQGMVESIFSTKPLQLTQKHFEALPLRAKVFTGIAKRFLREACREANLELVELLNHDDVAIYNSIPTAEGAIMLAIQNTDFTIHSSKAAVLGYGRTGITLARTLSALGAKVRVGVHRPDHYARVFEAGMEPFWTRDLKSEVKDLDLVFNTVPKMILPAAVLAQLPAHAVIIDLASAPGGTDFRYAEKRGLKAILAPSLPGIVAPKTAGRIIAKSLIQLVKEQLGKREE